jgi:hypothetical protein
VGDVTAASYTSYLSVFEPTETNRAPFAYSKYSGDSGFPIFAVMNGDLIYIAANYSTSGGSGPVVSSYITDLNAALAAFSGDTYQLTIANANIETSTWVANVIAAGSTVSSASAAAHDTFITSAKNGGFWSLISRLNTYGANTLAGALVPLVNTVGNSTDTNYNFVSGDFSLAVGLTGDGATKYLDTGAVPFSTSAHLMVSKPIGTGQANVSIFGISTGTRFDIYNNGGGQNIVWLQMGSGNFFYCMMPYSGMLLGTLSTSTSQAVYRNGTLVDSGTVAGTTYALPCFAFTANNGTGPGSISNETMQGYSIGSALTGTQAAGYYSALNALMAALGRTIPA